MTKMVTRVATAMTFSVLRGRLGRAPVRIAQPSHPRIGNSAAAASDRDKARTSWRCCDSFRATAAPINPVAPVTRIFIVPPSDN